MKHDIVNIDRSFHVFFPCCALLVCSLPRLYYETVNPGTRRICIKEGPDQGFVDLGAELRAVVGTGAQART